MTTSGVSEPSGDSDPDAQHGRTITEVSLLRAGLELWRLRYFVVGAALLGALLAWGVDARRPPVYEKRITFVVPPSDDSAERWARLRTLLDSGVILTNLGPESPPAGLQITVAQELKDANLLVVAMRLSDREALVKVAERVGAVVLERERDLALVADTTSKKMDEELEVLQAQAAAITRSLLSEPRTMMLRRGAFGSDAPRREGAAGSGLQATEEEFNPSYEAQRSLLLSLELRIAGMEKARVQRIESRTSRPLKLLDPPGNRVAQIPPAMARNATLGGLAGLSIGALAAVLIVLARRARAMLAVS